jgi:hypothetical protein
MGDLIMGERWALRLWIVGAGRWNIFVVTV